MLATGLTAAIWCGTVICGTILAETATPGVGRPAEPPATPTSRPPNIVLFVIDDLGWYDLTCYGSTFYRTPHLDRLARAGVRFTDFYAVCPVCSPTRLSILTGRYPQRVGITNFLPGTKQRPDQRLRCPPPRQELPLEEVTLAEALKARGYVTAHIGKWHLGGRGFGPTNQGFDLNIAGDETGTPRSYFAPFRNKVGVMPGLEEAPEGEYLTDRLAAEAVRFIAAHRDKPFFLYLPHYAVHVPLRAKPELVTRYPAKPRPGTQSNPVYAAMVESMDAAVGRVLQALEEHRLTEQTLVLFTSDNGGLATREGGLATHQGGLATREGGNIAATVNGPLRAGKGFLYEGGVRVPFIACWPGRIPAGQVCSQVACSNDLFATILEAAGGPRPGDPKTDGVSLFPAFAGQALPERAIYWHFPHYSNQGDRPGGAVRRGNYKLIEDYETGRRELYDLQRDLGETRNIAADQPELVRKLVAELHDWRQQVGARMPTPNPDYRPNPQAADGTVRAHARTALVFGEQLRYQPLPHQETLGSWTRTADYATFDITLSRKGTYTVAIEYSCGPGCGGSEVAIGCGDQTLRFTVEETGGFDQFRTHTAGQLQLDAGRHTLKVQPLNKPGPAVMELRQITLRPRP